LNHQKKKRYFFFRFSSIREKNQIHIRELK